MDWDRKYMSYGDKLLTVFVTKRRGIWMVLMAGTITGMIAVNINSRVLSSLDDKLSDCLWDNWF